MAAQEKRVHTLLTFRLGEALYAVHVYDVVSIAELKNFRTISGMSAFIAGIVQYEGKNIPVIDIKDRLGMAKTQITGKTCIVLVNSGRHDSANLIGFLTDEVCDVIEVSDKQMEPPPVIGHAFNPLFIKSVAHIDNGFVFIFNVACILDADQWKSLIEEANLYTRA